MDNSRGSMRPFRPVPRIRITGLIALLPFVLFGSSGSAPAWAGIEALPLHELHQQVWTTREGLPHNTINDIAQTPDGYLWFATWEGVARFNGHQFRVFGRSPETGLPDSGILTLSLTESGELLAAGARGGVSITDGRTWRPMPPADSMVMWAIDVGESTFWLGSQGHGAISRKVDENGIVIEERQFLAPATCFEVNDDSLGRIWAATSEGLAVGNAEGMSLLGSESGLPPGPAFRVTPVDDGERLLVGTANGLFVGDGEYFESFDERLDGLSVIAILPDPNGAIWLGTINQGLFRLSEDGIDHFTTADGLPNNRVMSLHRDIEGSLWVGTNAGLLRLRAAPFVSYTREQGLAGNYVRAVMPHSDGSLWVGTSEGVSRMTGRQIESVLVDGEPFTESTLSLSETSNGGVLIGTHASGVMHWQDGRIIARHHLDNGLPSNDIRMTLEDRQGTKWIATSNGLARIQDGNVRVIRPSDGLPGDFVIALEEDRHGTLWVGTGSGLARIDGDDIGAIPLGHLDDALYIYAVREDPEHDALWLGSDRGLIRFELATGRSGIVGHAAGMPIDKYFEVVDDHRGNFWLSSNRGVVRIDKHDANAVIENRLNRIPFELYTEGDGMASAQANGGSGPPAAFHDGHVWVATALGLASVDPGHLERYEDTELPVSIEYFEVDGIAWPATASMDLPPGSRRVVIQYAGLGYIMPQRIRYRTRLEGFEDQWVLREDQNIAEYTNLGPGRYRFHVTAAYPYGPWSDNEAIVEFSIAPLPWERPAFWVITVAGAITLIILLVRLRMKQLELRAGELRDEVRIKTRALRRQADEFERQARIDQLTGLPNRRAFDEWLARSFREARECGQLMSLVVMDLDHFKSVNDTYSHLVGDQIMRIAATILKDHVRENDQVARWGGEEFTLTFADSSASKAARVCERIRLTIEQTDFGDLAPDLRLTASFGISDNRNADSYENLLRQADQALYRAKHSGRNRIVIHPSDGSDLEHEN